MTAFKTIQGTVIKGDGVARGLGFPTANVDVSFVDSGLEVGIYAALVRVGGKKYGGALGVQSDPEKVEVHILDHDEDLYGQKIEIVPKQKMSDMQEIPDREELIKKIASDIEKVRAFFTQ